MSEPKNRLAGATSPYLRQHAHNPVDWFPWGDEAFEHARDRDVPLFLSIGYAACHWCHVMERESFEDASTARFLNDHFVAVKVDREERPDIDAVYMDAVQAMTGSGGWPMSVFLTPEGRPFYAATYLPDMPRYGMPSFGQVLEGITEAWRSRRSEVIEQGSQIVRIIEQAGLQTATASAQWNDPVDAPLVLDTLAGRFDQRWGGFGGAPKFPQPTVLEWLLRRAVRGDERAASMATQTLDRMAWGGIHDQVGGGFCRYSTDAAWHVPHFEKMLYDNAQLLQVYTHAWLLTRKAPYGDVAERTAEFLLSMRSTDGGFMSSLDADTEGAEGRYYTWSWDDLVTIVGADIASAFGATPDGNWEGTNVLWFPEGPPDDVEAPVLDTARRGLLQQRDERPSPAVDDKVIVAWNGLALRALSVAGRAFGRPELVRSAVECALFIEERLQDADGRLYRSFGAGRAEVPGFCDDYALLGLGLLALYEATGDARWFSWARGLADTAIELFADPAGGFYLSASDAGTPLVRPKDIFDAPLPSGNAAMCELLARIGLFTGEGGYLDRAERTAAVLSNEARRQPISFGHALCALDLLAGPTSEIAIVGAPGAELDALWAEVVRARFIPNMVLAVGGPSGAVSETPVPLLRDRTIVDGRATAYVCERFLCRAPVTEPEELAASL